MIQTGCVGLSREHQIHRWGVRASLVEAWDGWPLSREPVTVSVDGRRFEKTTNRSGGIEIEPETERYWTWLGGPAFASTRQAEIEFTAEDFKPLSFELDWNRPDTLEDVQVDRPFLNLETVEMQRR